MLTLRRRVLFVLLCASWSAKAEKILIHTSKPYQGVVQEIQRRGGTVSHQFQLIDAIAADVPTAAIGAIRALAGVKAVQKDMLVREPGPARGRNDATMLSSASSIESKPLDTTQLSALAGAHPDAYLINNALMNLGSVHGQGFTGQGVRVALIDSGIRPGFPHIAGKVLGSEDFVGAAGIALGFAPAPRSSPPSPATAPAVAEHSTVYRRISAYGRLGPRRAPLLPARLRSHRRRAHAPHHRRHGKGRLAARQVQPDRCRKPES